MTKVLSAPLVGSDANVHNAKFAILWRLKNSGSFEPSQRQIFDEVMLCGRSREMRASYVVITQTNSILIHLFSLTRFVDDDGSCKSRSMRTT